MNPKKLAIELTKNHSIVTSILVDADAQFVRFKPDQHSWSPLEVICHLVDEECEDFRARIQHLLASPVTAPPAIDPEGWVIERAYTGQDFKGKVDQWISEREKSILFLEEIENVDLSIGFDHAHFGRFDIQFLLNNWLAHDLLHIRQLTRLRYQYLDLYGSSPIEYAGKW